MFNLLKATLLPAALLALAACVPFFDAPDIRETREAKPRTSSTVATTDQPGLRAAESRIHDGELGLARVALRKVDKSQLTATQRTYRQILEAELALAEDRPLATLQLLPRQESVGDTGLAARIEEDRARALFRLGDAIGATEVLRKRGQLLDDTTFQAENRDLLWGELRRADLEFLTPESLQQADPVARGWIELAIISRAVWSPPQSLENRMAEWRAEYPQHPATDRISALAAVPSGRTQFRHIALLLPMTGAFAATGEAVRDGYFSGYFQVPGSPLTARVYDTGATVETFRHAWRKALDGGAEFAVGPLRRDMVNALVADGRPPIPVLALNYIDAGQSAPFNFFQWGLAPEDEARQAAERAIADSQYRAIALVPEGDWGARILAAFRERYEILGGRVIAENLYKAETRDHSDDIRKLLAIDWSEDRHRTLTNALGVKSEFEPRRRQDVDLVFIAARPDQARLLGPQLRFHRSGGLPVYATAAIYDGEPPAVDLNGLRFCDMPWMLAGAGAADERWAVERTRLSALFPQHRGDYGRLLALGRDAFTLITLIENRQLQPGAYFPAASGTLSLDQDGIIRRRLSCVEISKGALSALGPGSPTRQ